MAKKVLIVDDEQDIRDSVGYLVRRLGYEVFTASDGKKALAALRKQRFDLVFMDIFMPGMSGRECVELMRKDPKTRNTKVAFLTVAQVSETGRKELLKLKPIDYINKPIEISDFERRTKRILK